MKVCFFSASLRFSGGRLVMFRHANELARRGHDVTIWTQDVELLVDWTELHVPVRHAASFRTLPTADVWVFDRIRLAAPLQRAGLGKVVHLCQGYEGTDAELRRRSAWSERGLLGLPDMCKLWWRQRTIDRAYRLPTAKIVTHHPLGDIISRRFGQQSFFVPLGLPTGVFGPPAQRPAEAPAVLIVGPTDVGWKRVPDALHAIQLLKRRRPIRLVRVAQHPIRDMEQSLGVTDEYHNMLTPQQMADVYRKVNVLLISSDATEGFGLPVLEAMACGLPCVVTDIPAFRTFAQPDDYAQFVPIGDSARMASALEELLDSPEEQQRLSRRGLEVASQYTMQRSYDAMEAALLAIVDGAKARGASHGAVKSAAD